MKSADQVHSPTSAVLPHANQDHPAILGFGYGRLAVAATTIRSRLACVPVLGQRERRATIDVMSNDAITPGTYAEALAEAASLRDDRLNSRDKTIWWSTLHQMLTAHTPDGAACSECGNAWPCGTVSGAIRDIRSGALGY